MTGGICWAFFRGGGKMNTKKNILFLQPLYFNPTLPNFKDRFEMLSPFCRGHILAMTDRPDLYDGLRFGEFVYHAIPFSKNRLKKYFNQFYYSLRTLWQIRKEHIDIVYCYDPLILGITGVLIKLITSARLIIEINGHLKEDAFLEKKSFVQKIKRLFFIALIKISISSASTIKFLNSKQKKEWESITRSKHVVMFHDFVPTHIFSDKAQPVTNNILFMGYPFYRKGVDILIRSFLKISPSFPSVQLTILGHCPGGAPERQRYIDMTRGNANIHIMPPVFYDEALEYINTCRFLVLPSRSEAMGRVLIEAMAAGKPVIGSRVGGIPDVIEDGGNGFLFTREDTDDLADKIQRLLQDDALRERMGRRSRELVEDRFSAKKYVEHFTRMIEALNE